MKGDIVMKKYDKNIESEEIVEEVKKPAKKDDKIRITVVRDNLNIRADASYETIVLGKAKQGDYTIEKIVVDIDGNEWGKLEGQDGWVNMKFVVRTN